MNTRPSPGPDPQALRTRLAWLEWMMERAIEVPIIRKRIGGDALIGLIPGVGDAVGGLIGLYLVYEAARAGAPKRMLAGMIARVGLDTALGSVPLVGDLWDFFYSSNSRNLAALKRHLDAQGVVRPGLGTSAAPVEIEGQVIGRAPARAG